MASFPTPFTLTTTAISRRGLVQKNWPCHICSGLISSSSSSLSSLHNSLAFNWMPLRLPTLGSSTLASTGPPLEVLRKTMPSKSCCYLQEKFLDDVTGPAKVQTRFPSRVRNVRALNANLQKVRRVNEINGGGAKPMFLTQHVEVCMQLSTNHLRDSSDTIHTSTYLRELTDTYTHLHGASVRLGPSFVDQHAFVDIRQVAVELAQYVEVLLEVRRKHLFQRKKERGGRRNVWVCLFLIGNRPC